MTKKHIISEKIVRTKNRSVTVFVRDKNKIVSCIKEFSSLKKIILRNNASIISSAIQYEIFNVMPIYRFFDSITTNTGWAGRYDISPDYRVISKYYKSDPIIFKRGVEILKKCDLGITDIKLNKIKDDNNEIYYFPIFKNDADVDGNSLIYYDQSSGTKTLYTTLPYYLLTLSNGGVLLMDEFDTFFHPHMLSIIVELFESEEYNKKNAQLIFTTHNTDILNYMSKYRTVLVNKDVGESYAYRLDEISGDIIRNDRSLAPVYNSGKVGGVPRL